MINHSLVIRRWKVHREMLANQSLQEVTKIKAIAYVNLSVA